MLKIVLALGAQLALAAAVLAQTPGANRWPQLQASTIALTAHWEPLTDTPARSWMRVRKHESWPAPPRVRFGLCYAETGVGLHPE